MAVIKPVMGYRLEEPQGPRAEVDQRAEFEVVESHCPVQGQHMALDGQGGC